VTYGTGDLTVLLVDAGAKDNLVRSLLERHVRVIRAPWHVALAPLAKQSNGILIGNGPGDPKDLGPLIEQVRGMLCDGTKPILGVCLGNQILALAASGGHLQASLRTPRRESTSSGLVNAPVLHSPVRIMATQ
jgi:carbamoyl-phosphate synthase small subunit